LSLRSGHSLVLPASSWRVEQCRIKIRRQVDAFFALALAAAQVGDYQPGLFHQAVGFGKQRCAAIGQAVFSATGATLLGDAVRVGQCQQGAEPARVVGVVHRLGRLAAQVATVLPGQLLGALHATLGTSRALLAGHQRQAAVQVGTAAAQDIALAQQGCHVTGGGGEPQVLATQ